MLIALILALVGIFIEHAECVAAGQLVLVYGFNWANLDKNVHLFESFKPWILAIFSVISFVFITVSAIIGTSTYFWPYSAVSLIYGMCAGKNNSNEPNVILQPKLQYCALILSVCFAVAHACIQTDTNAIVVASIGAFFSAIADGFSTPSELTTDQKKMLALNSVCFIAATTGFVFVESAGIIAFFSGLVLLIQQSRHPNLKNRTISWVLALSYVVGLVIGLVSWVYAGKHGYFNTTSETLGIGVLSLVVTANVLASLIV